MPAPRRRSSRSRNTIRSPASTSNSRKPRSSRLGYSPGRAEAFGEFGKIGIACLRQGLTAGAEEIAQQKKPGQSKAVPYVGGRRRRDFAPQKSGQRQKPCFVRLARRLRYSTSGLWRHINEIVG